MIIFSGKLKLLHRWSNLGQSDHKLPTRWWHKLGRWHLSVWHNHLRTHTQIQSHKYTYTNTEIHTQKKHTEIQTHKNTEHVTKVMALAVKMTLFCPIKPSSSSHILLLILNLVFIAIFESHSCEVLAMLSIQWKGLFMIQCSWVKCDVLWPKVWEDLHYIRNCSIRKKTPVKQAL